MSHGGGGDDNVDPDLTPLLDLVLQLLMFFIINVNFVAEQVSPEVKLPASSSARPIEKPDTTALFVNQKPMTREFRNKLTPQEQDRLKNQDSVVLIPTEKPMSLLEAKAWLRDKYNALEKLSGGKVTTVVHFRPDADLSYGDLLSLMDYSRAAGFRKISVRAIITKGG